MKKRIISIILVLLFSVNLTAFADTTFTDVKEADDFFVGILYTSGKGFIHGMGNNLFVPQGILTVAQAIKIAACVHADFLLKEIIPCEESSHWADTYYAYAVQNGIMKEDDFNKADFDKPIKRDRLFYLFSNSLPEKEFPEINEIEFAPEKEVADYIEKLFCSGIVIGDENGFALESNITRAETVILLTRLTAYSRRMFVLEPMAK